MNLADPVLARLIRVVDEPDLSHTHFELRGELGRGGMGTVYRAYDTRLQREVALKVTESSLAEARIAASLEHPGIVPVYETGVLPDGRVFHAMRLVRGQPLQKHVTESMPLAERLAIFQKICEAVSFAHHAGVVHRDLKPSNIMVGEYGEVTILDWGLAGRDADAVSAAGTPDYVAPEQATGAVASPLADVYSLGALLVFLLPTKAPAPLQAIAKKARQTDPAMRYSEVSELASEVRAFQDGFAITAYRENAWEQLLRFVKRNKILLLLFAAYFATRIAVYIFLGR